MGAEAPCTLRFEGETAVGKALLETEELLFRPGERGGRRLVVPLREIARAEARDGVLRIGWGAASADFVLGAVAAKWLEKIKNPRSRLDKLGIKAGQRVALVGAVEEGFAAELEARGAAIAAASARAPADVVFLAADRRAALSRLASLVRERRLARNGAIWVLRPKGVVAIVEADVREAARAAGLVDVKVVAFSATHTAEKLVIPLDRR